MHIYSSKSQAVAVQMFQSDVGGNLSNLPAVTNGNDKKLPHLIYLQVSNLVLKQFPSTSMTIKNDAE